MAGAVKAKSRAGEQAGAASKGVGPGCEEHGAVGGAQILRMTRSGYCRAWALGERKSHREKKPPLLAQIVRCCALCTGLFELKGSMSVAGGYGRAGRARAIVSTLQEVSWTALRGGHVPTSEPGQAGFSARKEVKSGPVEDRKAPGGARAGQKKQRSSPGSKVTKHQAGTTRVPSYLYLSVGNFYPVIM